MPLPADFLALLDIVTDSPYCWKWKGEVKKSGEPFYTDGHNPVSAQEYAYEQLVGTVPTKQRFLHYLCHTTGCVNPMHVRPTSDG